MERQNPSKQGRLRLRRQTFRRMSEADLGEVVGGDVLPCPKSNIWTGGGGDGGGGDGGGGDGGHRDYLCGT